jgi:hypothetical protein
VQAYANKNPAQAFGKGGRWTKPVVISLSLLYQHPVQFHLLSNYKDDNKYDTLITGINHYFVVCLRFNSLNGRPTSREIPLLDISPAFAFNDNIRPASQGTTQCGCSIAPCHMGSFPCARSRYDAGNYGLSHPRLFRLASPHQWHVSHHPLGRDTTSVGGQLRHKDDRQPDWNETLLIGETGTEGYAPVTLAWSEFIAEQNAVPRIYGASPTIVSYHCTMYLVGAMRALCGLSHRVCIQTTTFLRVHVAYNAMANGALW